MAFLLELLGVMRPSLEAPPRTWKGVRGPIGAAILSLSLIHWAFKDPVTLQDNGRGREFINSHVAEDGPAQDAASVAEAFGDARSSTAS